MLFINGAEPLARIRRTFPEVVAVEMESTAIGHVCHQFDTPGFCCCSRHFRCGR